MTVAGDALEGEGKKEAEPEEKKKPEVGIKLGRAGRLKEGKAAAAGILAASSAGVGAGAAATNVVQSGEEDRRDDNEWFGLCQHFWMTWGVIWRICCPKGHKEERERSTMEWEVTHRDCWISRNWIETEECK